MLYANGTRKESFPSEGKTVVRFPNGDVKTTTPAAVVYYYAGAATTHTHHRGTGVEEYCFPNGQVRAFGRHSLSLIWGGMRAGGRHNLTLGWRAGVTI